MNLSNKKIFRKIFFKYSIIIAFSCSCIKEYDYSPSIILDKKTLDYKLDSLSSITIENFSSEQIILQVIYKDPKTGIVENVFENYDSPITIKNGYYEDYEHRLEMSYVFDSSTITYSCDYFPLNFGFRISVIAGDILTSKEIYFTSTIDNLYYSTEGSIYNYNYITNETKTIFDSEYASFENISYSSYDQKIYFSTSSSKKLQYYDLITHSLKTDFSIDYYQITNVHSISNSPDYIYQMYKTSYLRSDDENIDLSPNSSYYTLSESVGTYINNYNHILSVENGRNYSHLHRINSYSNEYLRSSFDEEFKNISLSPDNQHILYTLYNELYFYAPNELVDTYIASDVTDTDFNDSSKLIYIKNGNVYTNNIYGTNEVLLLDLNTDIKNISW